MLPQKHRTRMCNWVGICLFVLGFCSRASAQDRVLSAHLQNLNF